MASTHSGHEHGGHETSDHNIYSATAHHGSETMGSNSEERDSEPSHLTPSRKAILSEARDKATTAVELDNESKFEGAREAYSEACALLQQVLSQDGAEVDRRKLEAIVRFPDPSVAGW